MTARWYFEDKEREKDIEIKREMDKNESLGVRKIVHKQWIWRHLGHGKV